MSEDSEKRIEKWDQFEALARQHPAKESGGAFVFRGQADKSWKLEPSLLRWLRDLGIDRECDRGLAVDLELRAMRSFQRTWIGRDRPDEQEWIAWWGLMQHYEAVTRVLDWSGCAGVGLYFACNDKLDTCGKLWVLELDSLAERPKCFGDCYDEFNPVPAEVQQRVLKTAERSGLHWCRFKRREIRMAAQVGWFTTCTDVMLDHEEALGKPWWNGRTYPDALSSYVVPKGKKAEYLQRLRCEAIDGARLYGDAFDGIGYLQRETVAILRNPSYEAGGCPRHPIDCSTA